MPDADRIVLSVVADEAALKAYGDAVYFDAPDGDRTDMTGLFALRWLAGDEIKRQIIQQCPSGHVPVQTRLQTRRYGRVHATCQYRLEVRFLTELTGASPQLKLEYCVKDQTQTEITSGTVEMTFIAIAQLSGQ